MATPQECIRSWGLSEGQLSAQIRPLPNVEPGTVYPLTLKVGAEGMEPLEQQVKLQFTEEIEHDSASANDDVPPVEELEMPDIQTIEKQEWDSHWADWDQQTPVQIEGTNSDDMTIWVNYDAGPLLNFVSGIISGRQVRRRSRRRGRRALPSTR